jgi:3-oxoacyl-[acyl-carrier protein] reductase
MNDSQRVAIVTGGARGIPRAVAEDLARRGVRTAICYRKSRAEAEEALAAFAAAGTPGFAMKADVADPAQAEALVSTVRAELGPVSILVNGAGPYHRVKLLEETWEGWTGMFDANLHAVFRLSQLVIPDMREAGWGRIVNFGMANADKPMAQPMVTAHFIAKAGVLMLTRTLAKVVAPHGITVNAISPGFIDSGSEDAEMLEVMRAKIPAGRLGTVEETVHCVRFLLDEESSYVNGANLTLSGGWGL